MNSKNVSRIIISFLWFISIVGSQFYIFPSGLPQPAHILFSLIMLGVIFYYFKNNIYTIKSDSTKYIFLFLIYTTTVNMVWSIIEQDISFLISSVYWIFGFFLLLSSENYLNDKRSEKVFRRSSLFGLILLIIFYTAGLGESNYYPRYNGFFNDPNQLAFWVLCIFSMYLLISSDSNKLFLILLTIISAILIFVSLSRSALLGFVFIFIAVYLRLQNSNNKHNKNNKNIFRVFSLISILTFGYFVIPYIIENDTVLSVIDRFSNSDFDEQADIRGYYRVINYPEYLVFGSGQGLDYRFEANNEIHSSWVGLIFYYGFFGTLLFLMFLYKIFSKLMFNEKLVFMGPLIYGFSTYGLRTPIFWIFIASAIYAINQRVKSTL